MDYLQSAAIVYVKEDGNLDYCSHGGVKRFEKNLESEIIIKVTER